MPNFGTSYFEVDILVLKEYKRDARQSALGAGWDGDDKFDFYYQATIDKRTYVRSLKKYSSRKAAQAAGNRFKKKLEEPQYD